MGKSNGKIKIALYGMFGVYNYGCEAIVRGTINIIKKQWPKAEIYLVSPRIDDDKKRLGDLDLKFIERKANFNKKVLSKLAQKLNCGELVFREDLKWIDDIDMVFSVGGDLYTLSGEYKEPSRKYYNQLLHFGEIVKKKGKKFIIFGCSIGPFDGYPKAKEKFINHLKEVDLIVAREQETITYLNENMIKDNLFFAPDPAFTINIKNKKNKTTESLNIGINLSPLSVVDTGNKGDLEKIKEKHKEKIKKIQRKMNCKITLIPHVIAEDINDDDYRYLESIYMMLKNEMKENIVLLEKNKGFIGTKKVLKDIDIMVSARMHCAINAVESNIPTIFLSYSKKSIGMCKYIYGSDEYVIPLSDFNSEIIEKKITDIVEKKDRLHMELAERNKEIKKEFLFLSEKLEALSEQNKEPR